MHFHGIAQQNTADSAQLEDRDSNPFLEGFFFLVSLGCVITIPDTAEKANFTGHSLAHHMKKEYALEPNATMALVGGKSRYIRSNHSLTGKVMAQGPSQREKL